MNESSVFQNLFCFIRDQISNYMIQQKSNFFPEMFEVFNLMNMKNQIKFEQSI